MEIDLDKVIYELKNLRFPTKVEILRIIRNVSKILFSENNVLELKGTYNIIGDVHGQFFDVLNIFKLGEEITPETNTNYLFLGDYVDRGYNSMETILYLLTLKLKYPNRIYLLRGNHESILMTKTYSFKYECERKLDTIIYEAICNVFTHMPVAALINEKIFCVHGGISPKFKKISELNNNWRFNEKSYYEDLFWSDPSDSEGYIRNPRGLGFLFGKDTVDAFCTDNNISFIVRSHQLVMSGHEKKFDGKLFTIWSAPNYCYRSGNLACIMKIDCKNNYEFLVFGECENQKCKGETGKFFI